MCLCISLPLATAFSFVCFSPSGFLGLCVSGVLLILLLELGAPLGSLFELLLPLAVCAIALSFLFSIYLYIRSFWAPSHALALGGNTGERRRFITEPSIRLRALFYNRCQCAFSGLFYCFGGSFWYSCGQLSNGRALQEPAGIE